MPHFIIFDTYSVFKAIPENVARASLNLPPEEILAGEMKESTIIPWDTRIKPHIIEKIETTLADFVVLEKPVKKVKIDTEPPELFMLRPKLKRFESSVYTQWVKTQKCCCGCEMPSDDPHHIIGHGQGKMGGKTHDLFVIPLTRRCHDALHRDMKNWEQNHGSQLLHVLNTLNLALGLGVIA